MTVGHLPERIHPPASLQEKAVSNQSEFPPGWDAARVERVLEHYENQSDEAAVAEDENALETPGRPSWRSGWNSSPPSVA